MAKIVCVSYEDPITGYPPSCARDSIPAIQSYPDGHTLPSPSGLDFRPGEPLGCVSGGLGLRRFLEDQGHTFVVTSDKEGRDSVLDRELPNAEVVISQPFWPVYLTAERIEAAPRLRLASTTEGIGSDHVDLDAAIAHECFLSGRPIRDEIVHGGGLAGTGAVSYTSGKPVPLATERQG